MDPRFGFWRKLVLLAAGLLLLSLAADAQDISPPAPQRLTLHSAMLNEDRTIWVRTPRGYDQGTSAYSVLYLMDGPGHINEIGSTIDFLVEHDRMPPLIVVGIANTDRTRDLTPSHSDEKKPDGTEASPTSGGGDRFLDFIQKELMPEIEKRYRTSCYRLFAGHSLGGLMAIHALITRPDLFNAYIAVSPSLWWNDKRTLRQAQEFFAKREQLQKTLFFSLGNEGNKDTPMGQGFDQFREALTTKAPNDFHWGSARYEDEDHGSTVLRAHYAALRMVFADWQVPRDPDNGFPVGGLSGVEKHYQDLSKHYGCAVEVPESVLNGLGYQLMGSKKLDEAIAVFQRNVELYPGSANVYDSLGEGYENAGKLDLALKNVERAVAVGTKTGDKDLDQFRAHLKKLVAAKAADKAAVAK